jgi:hypothetical protein
LAAEPDTPLGATSGATANKVAGELTEADRSALAGLLREAIDD